MSKRIIKTRLLGKDEVFKVLALGEVSKLPVLLLGDPGVGKTQALLDFAAAKYNYKKEDVRNKTFVIELDEGTKTSEVKGRVNMKALLEDKKYKVDAPIADAEYVLINEVDKGTSGVRNTLLSIMREKAIFYGDEVKKCAWEIFAGSCNVIPEDELENPFWDRFVLTAKVDRVTADTIRTIWGTKKILEVELEIPTEDEIQNETIEKNKMFKFLDIVYSDVSDRTLTYVPLLVKAVKIIYKLNDIEALMKCCELVAPTKLTELSGKLESKRENNVRSQIESLPGVIQGGNNSYAQIFAKQICDELNDMEGMNTYKTKATELIQLLMDTLKEMNHEGVDMCSYCKEHLNQFKEEEVTNE